MLEFVGPIHKLIFDVTQIQLEAGDWALPPNRSFGDIAIPCFKLAKSMGKAPPLCAQDIAQKIQSANTLGQIDFVSKLQVAGPYLNFFLKTEAVYKNLASKIIDKNFGTDPKAKGKTIVIDFSSPNIAKELGLHHLRSTAIGHSLARIASQRGYKVVRLNYLGDWGTSFGKLICGLKKFGNEKDLLEKGLPYMLDLYVRFNDALKANPSLEGEAQEEGRKLEEGNADSRRLWQHFKDVSLKENMEIYNRIGVEFDHYDGESLYEPELNPKVEEIHSKIGTRISDGATVCDLPQFENPILLKRRDGVSLYLTRDLCAADDRYKRFHFDHSWYVVASQQKLHFEQLFAVLKAMEKPWADRLEHIDFGMLSFGDKTMKSREGNIIFLKDVLEEGYRRAKAVIEEKNPNLENADEVAWKIGVGALLFSDLSGHRRNNVKFNWEEALSFEGDTSPFIQYSYARSTTLLEKARQRLETLPPASNQANSVWEIPQLHLLITEWAILENYFKEAFDHRDPSKIAQGALGLAKRMNQLYHAVRFVDEQDAGRLSQLIVVVERTRDLLNLSLQQLGIQTPDRM